MADELEAARREIIRLRDLAEVYAQSARLHADRAAVREEEVRTIRRSTAWRLTAPLRLLGLAAKHPPDAIRRARRIARVLAKEGVAGIASRARGRGAPGPHAEARSVYERDQTVQAATLLAPRVLIIGELSIAQCTKYRVRQKQTMLDHLGTASTVLSWHDHDACLAALQTHPLVIFYRVPMQKRAPLLFAEARRRGVRSYWEVDDLIFDPARYGRNRNLDVLTPALRASLLEGAAEYRQGMLACERTIASTAVLAGFMQEAGAGPSLVVENALDPETIALAEDLRSRPPAPRQGVMIAYGSGTKTHDVDFTLAAPALARVMAARFEVSLRLVGELALPAALESFAARIERLPPTGYARYLALLAEADIAIAPLDASDFNDAKSNIKFIEAAILARPSVCSARASFRDVIGDGENGFLAEDDAGWERALLALIGSPELRHRIGRAALATVLGRYAPAAVAETQLAPLVAGLDQRTRPALRVLVVNIFFPPTSFGGATIVAEEIARRLHARDDTEVFVFTSCQDDADPHTLRRYEVEGMQVFGVRPPAPDLIADFDNPKMQTLFADVLRAVEPDVVHFHSLQMLSASLLRACTEAGVPFAVTVHDAWWLCARQFMVRGDDTYCFQTTIDLAVCQACLPGFSHLGQRRQILTQALAGAALVIAPSETHRQLYLANGVSPDRAVVKANGIRLPTRPRTPRQPGPLRFGYIGGAYALKGFEVIRAAFEGITSPDYALIFVDSLLKLGRNSIDTSAWRVAGVVRIVPPYGQDELDAFFDGIDVLLFPSQWKESFGLVVAEALARDVWVIASAGGGASELVVDGENGTLIPLTSDPRPLRAAAEALLAEPGRLAGHVNRHKAGLHGYDRQAAELRRLLQGAAVDRPAGHVTDTEPASY
ncbi:MAG: hypothetical protein NVSMB18_15620 [Acetobacteraceae bacterium]